MLLPVWIRRQFCELGASCVAAQRLVWRYDWFRAGPHRGHGPGQQWPQQSPLYQGLMEMNRLKTMAALVTIIVGMDEVFYKYLLKLFPHTDAKNWFTGN